MPQLCPWSRGCQREGEKSGGQEALLGISPTAPAPSGCPRRHGLGQGSKELNPSITYQSRSLAKALTLPSQSSDPGPGLASPLPSCPLLLVAGGESGLLQVTLTEAKQTKPQQTKTKRVFNRKNKKNCGKMWRSALPSPWPCGPLPSLVAFVFPPCPPGTALASSGLGDGQHCLQGGGQPRQCQEGL